MRVDNLDIEASSPSVVPAIIVDIGVAFFTLNHRGLPCPGPHHHVNSVLNLLWQSEFEVIGLLVHVVSGDFRHSIAGEVALRARDPVFLIQVLSVLDFSLRLACPEDTNEARITVVRGAYVPTTVTITPETKSKRIARRCGGHGCTGCSLARNSLVVTARIFGREVVSVVR